MKETTEGTEKRYFCVLKKHKEKVYGTTRLHKVNTEKQVYVKVEAKERRENAKRTKQTRETR